MSEQSRQLVAIMFTDIVGYTALMGEDEKKAMELLNKNRQIQRPIIEQYNGRWIKELGDGVMASFNTVSDAVNAAIKIQEVCNTAKDFQLRIGIHLGEVVFENEDVFGDGVNIAARIQALANPGSIFISESIHQNVSNKKDIQTKFVKEEALKNIKEPLKIFEILINTTESTASPMKKESVKSRGKSIAVLPFTNMSSDPEQEYFCDGITEEILNLLTRVKELKVTGRTSSFQFKGKQPDLREVGKMLNVQNLLEGSIRKQGNRVRITAQLINAEDGFHLWSERFDRELRDIFALQDEIALEVTKKLQASLTENISDGVSRTDLIAYDHYLLGRFSLNKRTSQSVTKAIACFKKSIETDPEFAAAYAGLADAYLLAAIGYAVVPAAIKLAKETSEKALTLNPNLSDPYVSIGYVHLNDDWNWDAAYKAFMKAIEINPNDSRAFQWLAQYYLYIRRYSEAIPCVQRAEEIEPLSALIITESSWPYFYLGQYEETIKILWQALKIDDRFALAHYNLAICFENLHEFDKALYEYKLSIEYSDGSPVYLAFYARCLIKTGKYDVANNLLKKLLELSGTGVSISLFIAMIYETLGQLHEAVLWLEQAIDAREPVILMINTNWMSFKAIIDTPGFHVALKKLPTAIRDLILPSVLDEKVSGKQ